MKLFSPWRGLAMWLVLSVVGVQAQVFTYQISGTLDAGRGSVFGMDNESASFTGTFTVDLSLNTSTTTVLTGGMLFDNVAQNDFYGFSKSSIVSFSLTTGTRTWTEADIDFAADTLGVHFWASSDLTTAPQYVKFTLYGGTGIEGEHEFSLGSVTVGSGQISIDGWSVLNDGDTDHSASGYYTSITAVPEPSVYALMAGVCALVGVAVRRRRR